MQMDKNMLAYCGLYCEQCSFKLAHDENDRKHLDIIPYAVKFGELSEYNCGGCKGHCICGVCKIKPCASLKGIDSCADCASFPCEHIITFENDGMPHHKSAVANLYYIKQYGIQKWFDKLKSSLQHDSLSNLDKIHTTKLGVERIKRNLKLETDNVVLWCKQKHEQSKEIIVKGKNWYVSADDAVITINAHSFTIITAHRK